MNRVVLGVRLLYIMGRIDSYCRWGFMFGYDVSKELLERRAGHILVGSLQSKVVCSMIS